MAEKPTKPPPRNDDELIRRYGFAIHSRPRDGEAVWTRNGKLVGHSAALEIARRAQRNERELYDE